MQEANKKADKIERSGWIRLLANADVNDLEKAYDNLVDPVVFNHILQPETGLLMVQGRADGDGRRFHAGEISVTKCILEVGGQYLGYGMVTGSDKRHAQLAALFDGMLQHPRFHGPLKKTLLAKLDQKEKQSCRKLEKEVADTRVEFFTLKRGE